MVLVLIDSLLDVTAKANIEGPGLAAHNVEVVRFHAGILTPRFVHRKAED